jgi:uncharacterized protein (DUF885 family)
MEQNNTQLKADANSSQLLDTFFETCFQRQLDNSPNRQTELGLGNDHDKWDDLSDEHTERERLAVLQDLETLNSAFELTGLSPQQKLSARLYEYDARCKLDDYAYRHHDYLLSPFFGLQMCVTFLLFNYHQVTSLKGAEDYISRLRNLPDLFQQAVNYLEESRRKGIMLPAFAYDASIKICADAISGIPLKNADKENSILVDFRNKLDKIDITKGEKSILLDGLESVLSSAVKPAYELLIDYLKESCTGATEDEGIWKFPDGEKYYRHLLGVQTQSDLSAEQIHEIGLSEVGRIHKEMESLLPELDFDGELIDYFKLNQSDARHFFPNTEEGKKQALDRASTIVERVKSILPQYFNLQPTAELLVERMDVQLEENSPVALYRPAMPDGSVPGAVWINFKNLNALPRYVFDALIVHEGVPGHHMQFGIMNDIEDIPRFQKYRPYDPAYAEGWALYSEVLAKEMGIYADSYSLYGFLAMDLWRSCRLVVDTGIHKFKWTRKQAVQYFLDNTPFPREQITTEVDRYTLWPGQACSYKIGCMKILELRGYAKEKLGSAFCIKEFHDTILGQGQLPLPVLEEWVREWVAEKERSALNLVS